MSDNPKSPAAPTWAIILILIVLVGLIVVFNKPKKSIASSPEQNAWTACTLFVEKQMNISSFDAQRYSPSQVTTQGQNFYTVEVHYASQNATYRCGLQRHDNGNWELHSLDMQ